MERGRDESNFRAKRSRLHGKNIIRGIGLSFLSRQREERNDGEEVGDEGDGAISVDVEEGGGIQVIERSVGAFDRGREKICSVSGFREYEKFKSLRVSPGLLRVYCEVIKSFYRLPCFFRLTRLDSTRLTHSRTAKSCFV